MKKLLILTLLLLPLISFKNPKPFSTPAVPGCGTFVSSGPITATSNSTISGKSIDLANAAIVGINVPNGVHDVHITKCIVKNGTTKAGLIQIGSGCYNITVDTCFLEAGYRGIYAHGATNNIHLWYNYIHNIVDPGVLTSHTTDGGGSSIQLDNCNGTSIQILDNKSYHDVSSSGVGDQWSLYQCNGTAASPIRVCRNQALNGSTNIPANGYVGAVGGDVGGSYQRLDSNIYVNVGSVLCQIQGGHDIEMSYNTGFLAQSSYTSVGMAFGNYSGVASYNITMAFNNVRAIQASGSVFNYWFDPNSAFAPNGWATNTTSTSLNANILPNPLWPPCNPTVLPPVISYTPTSYSFTTGTPIASIIPSSTGGPVVNYTVSPPLPGGIGLNSVSGILSGTPSVVTSSAVYTVVAHNSAGTSSVPLTISVKAPVIPAPVISYSPNSISPTVNTAISNLSASNTGGAVTSWSVSPSPPTGIIFNSGTFSGTPTVIQTAQVYTVTATNGSGSSNAPVTITVLPVRPSISYTGSPYTFTQGSAIVPLTASNSGGAGTFTGSLPPGLSLNSGTGQITGTPTTIAAAANFVITCTNAAGNSQATLNITVQAPAVIAPAISYSPNTITVAINNAIANLSPINTGGAAVSYSCSPTPPSGISFSTSNGLFSGTPTVTSSTTSYSITATNSGGTSPVTHVSITVNQVAAPSITYPYNTVIYIQGQPISAISPTNSGGPATSYAISAGTLPPGLSLNTSTGVISGAATLTQSPTSFTVRATNAGGNSDFSIQAAVNAPITRYWYIIDGKFGYLAPGQ